MNECIFCSSSSSSEHEYELLVGDLKSLVAVLAMKLNAVKSQFCRQQSTRLWVTVISHARLDSEITDAASFETLLDLEMSCANRTISMFMCSDST